MGFRLQQADYFETGDGRNAFGPSQEIALAAARQIVLETRRTFARSVRTGEIPPEAVDAVPAWASSHPIRGGEMHRESLLSSDWNALGIEESSLPGTVASLNQTLVGVTQRLGYVNEGLLKRVRWQGKLMVGTALRAPRVDSLLTTLHATAVAIGKAVRDGPADLRRAREAVARDLGAAARSICRPGAAARRDAGQPEGCAAGGVCCPSGRACRGSCSRGQLTSGPSTDSPRWRRP